MMFNEWGLSGSQAPQAKRSRRPMPQRPSGPNDAGMRRCLGWCNQEFYSLGAAYRFCKACTERKTYAPSAEPEYRMGILERVW
jgi:hypothetical protein